MLMLAANHTQNSCAGCPVRSSAGTGSMPRVSNAAGELGSFVVVIIDS